MIANFNHSRLNAAPGGPAIEQQIDAAVEILQYMLRGGGAGVAEAIGAGRRDGKVGRRDKRKRDGMRRHANADELAPGSHSRGHCRLLRQQDGQRAGPELVHERIDFLLRVSRHAKFATFANISRSAMWTIMGSQAGRCLARKILLHCGWIERVCAQAVDSFRRKRHGAAGANDFRSLGERGLRGYRGAGFGRNRQPDCIVCGHQGLRGLRAQRKSSVFHPNLSNVYLCRLAASAKLLDMSGETATGKMETEVKVRLADRAGFTMMLPALGFHLQTAETMERNVLFDKR